MSWNYRVTNNNQGYAIREVYYDETTVNSDGLHPVQGYTKPLTGYWETPKELIRSLEMMLDDANRSELLVVADEGEQDG
jgi:hypothetical protein